MVGQGSPSAWKVFCSRCALWQIGLGTARLLFCGLVLFSCGSNFSTDCSAAEKTVRLRLAWGSGTAAKQRWVGTISIEGGVLSELQPLGIEADAPVALRIDGSQLIVAPLEKRGFDGCDVMVRADEQARVRVELRSEQSPQATVFEAPLSDVIDNQLGQKLDELGSYFLARRSPGDVLRVLPTRKHLVFDPGEKWNLKLQPDLASQLAAGPVLLDVQLRATGEDKPIWQSTQQILDAKQLEKSVDFEIVCPATEGAYRLTVTARPEEGFATRFVPGQQAKPIATRDVEFVVIDPEAKLPRLVDDWLPILTIDPANPHWWQRLPAWAQVPRLRNRNLGAVGNVRPVVRPTPTGELVELPPAAEGKEPYWQSYTLPVREPGQPHLVEIEYPLATEQHLAISVIEPDAAGRVTDTSQDASLASKGLSTAGDGEVGVHRFVFWPRTRSPQLLMINRHSTAPAQFGKIKLSKQDTTLATLTEPQDAVKSDRLVARYLAKPLLAKSFGAAEWLDVESGLSVQSWDTFLDASRRLAQSLRFGGYNGVMISVAADGSGLYPSQVINPSPRYDTGVLASNGQDPMRKDVLEMLLRVFDREGIRVVPTVQLAAPLPRLEALRRDDNSQTTGVGCIGYNGQSWLDENPTSEGLAPFYNPLNDRVQAELTELLAELTTRYGKHSALAGVGVQLSGAGYGLAPGLSWGLDDNTVEKFSQATGLALPRKGPERFRQRADLLLGEHRQAWLNWRMGKISQLYSKLAQQLTSQRSDLRLILSTEALFEGPQLQQQLRQAIADPTELRQVLHEHGLDLARLEAQPAITALATHRASVTDQLQERALDLRVNSAAEQGEFMAKEERSAEMFFHATSQFRLPSFDERSPFGAEKTFLTVSSQPQAANALQQQLLVTALAGDDALTVVEGGRLMALNANAQTRDILRVLQQLPGKQTEARTLRQQPVVMRVYRTEQTTFVTLTNETPWPVQVEVPLTGSRNGDWKKLGDHEQAVDARSLAGTLTASEQTWQVELRPYDLQAWRFADQKLRVGEPKITLNDIARQDLQQWIHEIESRAGNLNIERPYPHLNNPGFELQEGSERIVGWQPRRGTFGAISPDSEAPHSGTRALKLKSENAEGVALQSHLFPAPATGLLMVSVYLKVNQLEEDAKLQIAVQDQHEGRGYHQFAVLGNEQLTDQGWRSYEFALNDVPFGKTDQLRLHFHLTGNAELLVDDVELFDLRFNDARRRALVKRIYAAKIALEQGKVVDCLRVVDDYWLQYLVEHVPSTETVASLATKPTTKTDSTVEPAVDSNTEPTTPEDEKGFGSRLRGWVPRIWR